MGLVDESRYRQLTTAEVADAANGAVVEQERNSLETTAQFPCLSRWVGKEKST